MNHVSMVAFNHWSTLLDNIVKQSHGLLKDLASPMHEISVGLSEFSYISSQLDSVLDKDISVILSFYQFEIWDNCATLEAKFSLQRCVVHRCSFFYPARPSNLLILLFIIIVYFILD